MMRPPALRQSGARDEFWITDSVAGRLYLEGSAVLDHRVSRVAPCPGGPSGAGRVRECPDRSRGARPRSARHHPSRAHQWPGLRHRHGIARHLHVGRLEVGGAVRAKADGGAGRAARDGAQMEGNLHCRTASQCERVVEAHRPVRSLPHRARASWKRREHGGCACLWRQRCQPHRQIGAQRQPQRIGARLRGGDRAGPRADRSQ